MNNKINIEYRPKEQYKKNYYMEGTYIDNSNDKKKEDESQNKNLYTNIKNDLDTIDNLIDGLPNPVQSFICTPIAAMNYVLGLFDPELKDNDKSGMIIKIPNEIYDERNNKDSDNSINTNDSNDIDLFPSLPNIEIDVIKEPDPEEKIRLQFQKDVANIFDDFNNKLKHVLGNYYSSLLKAAKDCGIENYLDLQKPFKSSDNTKNKFVSDSIIKSQIIREQKQRLIKKLFNIDEMIITIRKCKIALELKIRYYQSQYDKNDTFLKLNKNTILSDSRLEYDKKYKENLYGLYKCLNSIVILLDECLQDSLKESQGKAILIKEEGIKL